MSTKDQDFWEEHFHSQGSHLTYDSSLCVYMHTHTNTYTHNVIVKHGSLSAALLKGPTAA